MSEPEAILTLVTLGVRDLKRSIAFYEAIGCKRKVKVDRRRRLLHPAGLVTLAVYPLDAMAKDAGEAGDIAERLSRRGARLELPSRTGRRRRRRTSPAGRARLS